MANKKFLKNPWIYTVVIILLVIIIFWYNKSSQQGQYDEFAKCLTEKGAYMYGTDWCPHCKDQKNLFGKSFKNINYINCDYNRQECLAAGVEGYPTWKINNENYPGTQSLARLSELSGCEIEY